MQRLAGQLLGGLLGHQAQQVGLGLLDGELAHDAQSHAAQVRLRGPQQRLVGDRPETALRRDADHERLEGHGAVGRAQVALRLPHRARRYGQHGQQGEVAGTVVSARTAGTAQQPAVEVIGADDAGRPGEQQPRTGPREFGEAGHRVLALERQHRQTQVALAERRQVVGPAAGAEHPRGAAGQKERDGCRRQSRIDDIERVDHMRVSMMPATLA